VTCFVQVVDVGGCALREHAHYAHRHGISKLNKPNAGCENIQTNQTYNRNLFGLFNCLTNIIT
jgi:hypothetical protein